MPWPALLVTALLLPGAAAALDLTLPGGATLTVAQTSPLDSARLPTGPFANGEVPVRVLEGRVTRRAWRLAAQTRTTLQMLAPLRAQLRHAGYEVLLHCDAEACGGFDFRFAAPVLPAPDMQVDLFDFRYLLARKGRGAAARHAALLVSRAGQTGYVQLILVEPAAPAAPPADGDASAMMTPADGDAAAPDAAGGALARALLAQGHVVLDGLGFGSGAADLGAGPHAGLAALAAFLRSDPSRRVALVGHTDMVGGLDTNIALSRARAEAVRTRLARAHGVPEGQMEAHGIGYLSPRAPNLSAAGRAANRRVEAVLLNPP